MHRSTDISSSRQVTSKARIELTVNLNTLRRDQLRAGGGLSEIRSGIFGLCLNAVGQWFRCIDGVYSRRFSASILPGVKSFFGDLACTVAISAFEPCDLRYSAPDFPMAATNRAFHHVFVLLFVRLNHRLFPKGVLAAFQRHCRLLSAVTPIADKRGRNWIVRYVPLATNAPQQIASLFDHLVGAGEKRGRNCKAQSLCGLEVDDQLKFCRCLHRKIARLLAFQNSVDIRSRSPEYVPIIWAISEQSSISNKKAIRIHGW